jgi:hypothetical protein
MYLRYYGIKLIQQINEPRWKIVHLIGNLPKEDEPMIAIDDLAFLDATTQAELVRKKQILPTDAGVSPGRIVFPLYPYLQHYRTAGHVHTAVCQFRQPARGNPVYRPFWR